MNIRQTAQNTIPDDPEASAYRFIVVAAKRARQLQNGAELLAHNLEEADSNGQGRGPAGIGQI